MVTYSSNPVAVDAFIVEFNSKITTLLSWLNNPLGRIQPVHRKMKNRLVQVPAMHDYNGEYIEVYPSDTLTNYSWFSLGDTEPVGRSKFLINADFNLFLNLQEIYPLVINSRDLENVKLEIYEALETITLRSGAIRINRISEDYRDVYRGFDLAAQQDKYFMQPYAGLSFNLDLYIKNTNRICPAVEIITADSDTVTADSTTVDASGGTI